MVKVASECVKFTVTLFGASPGGSEKDMLVCTHTHTHTQVYMCIHIQGAHVMCSCVNAYLGTNNVFTPVCIYVLVHTHVHACACVACVRQLMLPFFCHPDKPVWGFQVVPMRCLGVPVPGQGALRESFPRVVWQSLGGAMLVAARVTPGQCSGCCGKVSPECCILAGSPPKASALLPLQTAGRRSGLAPARVGAYRCW